MTEPTLGRSARWGTAVLLVPTSAAVLGGAVWWAGATTPRVSSPVARPAPSAPVTAPVDPRALAVRAELEREIVTHRQNAARLERRLALLRARLRHLDQRAAAGSAPVPPTSGGGSVGSSGGGGYAGGSNSGGGMAAPPPPAPVVQAPPPPPPATNGGTGASGARP